MYRKRGRIVRWQEGNPVVPAIVLGAGLIAFLTLVNSTVFDVPALRALYILPIWIGTRLGGRISGLVLVALSTSVNIALDFAAGNDSIGHLASGLLWLGVFALVMLLVAHVEDLLLKSELEAHQDPLTGLFNRRGLEIEGRRLVHEIAQNHGTVSVAMLDCDRFKEINDEHGHRAGDEALRFLAQILRNNTRETDVVSRLGGDEFVLILPDIEYAIAQKILERVQKAFDKGMEARGFNASLSIGLVQSSAEVRDLRTLVARADEAMYNLKESKKLGYAT
jgi:diguanylate cyclase (GGDEF)-like protein